MSDNFHFFDKSALLDRLSKGIRRNNQEAVFLVGAPLSAPYRGSPGVPGVEGVIQLIRREFDGDSDELDAFDSIALANNEGRYQAAFLFLNGRRGQQTANAIIRRAVLSARVQGSADLEPSYNFQPVEDACRQYESDNAAWALSPATQYLGKLCVEYSNRFGKTVLTTNFDPLIELSIRRAGGSFYRTTLHADGNLAHTGKRLPCNTPSRVLVRIRYPSYKQTANPDTT